MTDGWLSYLLGFFASNRVGLEGPYYTAAALAAVGAVLTYIANSAHARRRREAEAYEKVNERYVKYCELVIQNPGLDVDYDGLVEDRPLTPEQKVQQHAMFDIFTAMAENAFLIFQNASTDQRRNQWQGWQEYIERYCNKKSYRDWWHIDPQVGDQKEENQFDKSFQMFIVDMIRRAEARERQSVPAGETSASQE